MDPAAIVQEQTSNRCGLTHIASATATYGFTFQIAPPNGTTATALRDKTTACDFRITYSVRTMNTTALTNVSIYDFCVVASGTTDCPQL